MVSGKLPVQRRLLVTGGLGAVAVASGCDVLSEAPPADPETSGAAPSTPPDGDSGLTIEITTLLAETVALADATTTRFPALRNLVRPYVALHDAHAALLGGPAKADPPTVRGKRARARQQFLAAEARLQQELVRATMAAESGALAQNFAAMAAAVAQRRAVSR